MGVINYADKYSNILDEKFKVESKSDIAVNQDYDFVGAKTVKIQSVNTVELSNYTRSGSNRYGTPNELDNAIQEMTMSQDKSFTFTIDKIPCNITGVVTEANQQEETIKEIRRIVDEMATTVRKTKNKID